MNPEWIDKEQNEQKKVGTMEKCVTSKMWNMNLTLNNQKNWKKFFCKYIRFKKLEMDFIISSITSKRIKFLVK